MVCDWDFNILRSLEEKASGGRIASSMRAFNMFIDDSRLFDPEYT